MEETDIVDKENVFPSRAVCFSQQLEAVGIEMTRCRLCVSLCSKPDPRKRNVRRDCVHVQVASIRRSTAPETVSPSARAA